jgi:hypothetical protein
VIELLTEVSWRIDIFNIHLTLEWLVGLSSNYEDFGYSVQPCR